MCTFGAPSSTRDLLRSAMLHFLCGSFPPSLRACLEAVFLYLQKRKAKKIKIDQCWRFTLHYNLRTANNFVDNYNLFIIIISNYCSLKHLLNEIMNNVLDRRHRGALIYYRSKPKPTLQINVQFKSYKNWILKKIYFNVPKQIYFGNGMLLKTLHVTVWFWNSNFVI